MNRGKEVYQVNKHKTLTKVVTCADSEFSSMSQTNNSLIISWVFNCYICILEAENDIN